MTIPRLMRAVRIRQLGGPEVLELVERPVPRPGRGDVLLKVEAAGVNRADIILRQPDLPLPVGQRPEIPGLEIAGTVVQLGSEVSGFSPGDRLCALLPRAGGYADYAVAPASLAFPVPNDYGFEMAAALPEALLTVWNALFDAPVVRPGESLLIHGGSSGIGSVAVMLSVALGSRVFATAGSEQKCGAVEAWGAERGINYRTEDFVEVVCAATADRGVDVILDMVAGTYISRNVSALAVGGRIVQIGMMESAEGPLNIAPLMAKRASIIGASIFFQSVTEKARLARAILQHAWRFVESGAIKPVVDRVFALEDAAAAQHRMESSAHIGKIILRP